jgi:UPF0755 protein
MKRFIVFILLIIIIVLGSFLWWGNAISPADPNNKNTISFVAEKGQGVREIAAKLKTLGIIRSPVAFFLKIKIQGLDKNIQAGKYCFSPSMTMQEVTQKLINGGTCDIKVKIIEGKRATEIAEILKANISTYDPSWLYSLIKNEGYLFPDTYLIPADTNIETIITQMRDNFDQKYAAINTDNSKLGKSQIVILASLIEREASNDEEKPVIAGILTNRLSAGIALQVDATIQYAKGKNTTSEKWWEPVTIEEYKSVVSNYNTYLFTGLPPGPICNPGLASLSAAASPADTNYLYYLHDSNGQIHYAKTITEHEGNIRKYL